MKINVISDSYPPTKYNDIVSHPLQLWEWGDARKKMGLSVVRFGEFKEEKLDNAYQMTIHPIPHTPFSIGYIPRSSYPSTEFLRYVLDYGKKQKLIFIKFEPYTLKFNKPTISDQQLIASINISSHPLFPPWTQVLDISQSEEELLKGMKPKTRYNIKLATKKGVIIKEVYGEKGFEIFSKLYFETCKRQGYYGHSQQYHHIIWNTLKKSAHILVAFYSNIPLAAYELFYFKNRLYYPYGGTSPKHRNVMAANLLMWETIKLGKKLGANTLDMWGSLPPRYDPNHDWAGFTRFKEGYGTKFIELCDSFDLVCNPLLYKGYNVLYQIRQLLLRLR